jgi:hypothetical protein
MQMTHVKFRKSFSRTSSHGITFHWLRCTYSKGFNDAIAEAAWIVYAPATFVALAASGEKITSAVIQSRESFRQMMTFANGSPRAGKPIPLRVEVVFGKKLDSAFKESPVLEWLLRTYGDEAAEAIIHAVWLVYAPAALAGSQEDGGEALVQAERSRLVFEQKMAYAIAQSTIDDKTKLINRLNKTLTESSDDVADKPATTALAAPADIPTPPETESVESVDKPVDKANNPVDDFDDDYVPAEYDSDFDN